MPRTRGRGGGEAQGIRTRGRGDELSSKGGIGRVTNIKRVRFNIGERYLNIDRKIGLTNRT
jgi:hypothetical protein